MYSGGIMQTTLTRPKPNKDYYNLPLRDAMIVARNVARRKDGVDFQLLKEWTEAYMQNEKQLPGQLKLF